MAAKLKVLDGIARRIAMFPQVRNFIAVILEHQRLTELDEILTSTSRWWTSTRAQPRLGSPARVR